MTKNDQLVRWIDKNVSEESILLVDSWYTNMKVIGPCVKSKGIKVIGSVRSSLKFNGIKVRDYIANVRFDKTVKIKGKMYMIHEEIGYFRLIGIPMKIVVSKDEKGRIKVIVSSDIKIDGEKL